MNMECASLLEIAPFSSCSIASPTASTNLAFSSLSSTGSGTASKQIYNHMHDSAYREGIWVSLKYKLELNLTRENVQT